ncbi:HET-domain-containing protein [Melanomma pulvis-pyrius CBS 109.77]|uniref:HET-domain-containing protein n=1 Tax=Melanomma pulvis-pyrius CBS 109.77 TaxID=1314802 RepID=A0A6A6XEB3_9PLEO|nr:HET-domain-containing protein [Melanomma pulvis-pyrius CBS 109.77]
MKHQLASIGVKNLGVVESTRLAEIVRKYKHDTIKPGQGWNHAADPDVLAMCKDFMDMMSDKKGTERPSSSKGPNPTAAESAIRENKEDEDGENYIVQGCDEDDYALAKDGSTASLPENKSKSYKAEETSEERFSRYKHHQFVRRWGLVQDPAPNQIDEEWYIQNPPILPNDDPQYLCEMCRHINFNALLEQHGLPGNQLPGPTSLELLGFWKVKQEVSCRFCTLLRRSMERDKLLASELQGNRTRFKLNVLDEGPGHALRLEVELDSIHPRIILQKLDSSSRTPLHGLPVNGEATALDRLRGWLHVCENEHVKLPDHVQRSLKLGINVLRVIDTEENRICEKETSCRYVCLSYVWGPPSRNHVMLTTEARTRMETIGGLVNDVFDLPPTIKDAMKVTRGIGLRYLWVDALCIIQDDDDDKRNFIPNMDIIYGNATLTIVACTNSSPAEALPGISVPRQQTQIVEEVQGLILGAALSDTRRVNHEVEASMWNSRAWTFQERGLSQRAVYLTHSQMSFTCPHGSSVEDTVGILEKVTGNMSSSTNEIDPERQYAFALKIWDDRTQGAYRDKTFVFGSGTSAVTLHYKATSSSDGDGQLEAPHAVYYCRQANDTRSIGIFQQVINQETLWDLYRRAVKGYTQRNMSVQSDAVNAFAGITHLISQGTNTKFWNGMPEFAFDQALLWVPREPLTRRCDQDDVALFPSWAWAAWQGHTSYHGRKWHNADNRPPCSVVEWLIEQDPEQVLRNYRESGMPEDVYQKQKALIESSSLLLAKADLAKLYHLTMRDGRWNSEWVLTHEENTRHIYTHEAYKGVKFDYPISLPGESVEDRPGKDGTLRFRGRAVEAKLCDMAKTDHIQEPLQEGYLQLGLGDGNSMRRIIYHQGYRAGVLSLNVTDQDIRNTTDSDGNNIPVFVVAMSRDSLQEVPHFRSDAFLRWQVIDARFLQMKILGDEWEPGPTSFTDIDNGVRRPYGGYAKLDDWMLSPAPMVIIKPDGTVAPDKSVPVAKDGDPYWDEGRFGEPGYCDVYNVLLIRPVEANDADTAETEGIDHALNSWLSSSKPGWKNQNF